MPFRKVFLSRWSALLWAAGIVWTAVDTVGFAPAKTHNTTDAPASLQDANGEPVTPEDVAGLAGALGNE